MTPPEGCAKEASSRRGPAVERRRSPFARWVAQRRRGGGVFLFGRTMKSGERLQQIRCIYVYLPEVSQFRQFIIKQYKSFSGTGWVSFDLSQALQAYDLAKVEELRQNFVWVIFHGHVGDICLDRWNQGEVRESVLGLEG